MNSPQQIEADFVSEIKAKIAESVTLAFRTKEMIEQAITTRAKAGVLLIEMKARLPASKPWAEWLRETFDGEGQSVRTMQRVEALGRDYLAFDASEAKETMTFIEWMSRMRKLPPTYQQLEWLPESSREPGSQVAHDHSERWILSAGKALSDVRDMLKKHPISTWSAGMRITVKSKLEPVRNELNTILARL